jgi:uncharacterized repeat protein (TIGR03803 family)
MEQPNTLGSLLRFTLATLALAVLIGTTVTAATAQTVSVLYNFGATAQDPILPEHTGIIAQGRDGSLYSTTIWGGNGNGTVFAITPQGTLTVLYFFGGTGGQNPWSGLTLGSDGNFYGAARNGGTLGYGTLFKISAYGNLTVVYNFTGGDDGAAPLAPPIQGANGNFYGTTSGNPVNNGTVYSITPSGKFTTLHKFSGTDGGYPFAPLVQAKDGSFWGTTLNGGATGNGTVFRITTAGAYKLLYSFTGGSDSKLPGSPLIQGNDGNFYGTTMGAGVSGPGTVFRITPTGKLTTLHTFNGSDGLAPMGGLALATDGNYYGTTHGGGTLGYGVIYRITPQGVFSVLYNFDGTNGSAPMVTLMQQTAGIVYGDTFMGGTYNNGTFYSLDVGLKPFVKLMTTQGKAEQVVEILGQGFKGTTSVMFGTGSTSFTIVSDTYLTAKVPATGTTGYVTVTTPSGTLKSSQTFKVLPVITSFTPQSGPVGTKVTITGSGFIGATKVTFGGVKAISYTVDSGTQITATVPTGAKTGNIAVTTPGGSASKGKFTVL